MIKKIKTGFTLVEVIIASLVIIFISSAIYYGMLAVNYSIRDSELNQKAFIVLSNKIEQLKAEVALGHRDDGNDVNEPICIEYDTIKDMVRLANSGNSGANSPGCKTNGLFGYKIRQRNTESLNAKVCDIDAYLTWNMITRFGYRGRDTTLALSTTQLVFN